MEDLGHRCSYMTLEKGARVVSSDGKTIGKVEYVLADAGKDVFDGIVLDTSVLPGGRRFVDAPEVAEVYERGVVISLDAKAAESLPPPSRNPAQMSVGPDDLVRDGGGGGLRGLWGRLTGRR